MILVSASLAVALGDDIPGEIVYLPEGRHNIYPTVNGKPKEITVEVSPDKGVQIAAALQRDLDQRNAGNVRGWFDFEHKRGAASAIPKGFRYETGRGVIAAVEWTGAGRAAIAGKDFSYFSPEFLMDDDGTPAALPDRGPLGALVNEPAFREIPRIAAGDAATDPNDPIQPSQPMKLILASLGIDPAHTDAENSGVKVVEKLKSDLANVQASLADKDKDVAKLKTRAEAAEAEVEKARKLRAESLVKAAVADGRILAKDEEKQTKFRDRIAAGDAFAEDILAGLPKINADLDKSVIKAGDAKKGEKKDESDPYARVEAAFAKELGED